MYPKPNTERASKSIALASCANLSLVPAALRAKFRYGVGL